ncbi:MAG: hypothetical protein Q8Q90_01445 [bacterium]|nr:hypothetical protein [bacterium]
MNKKLKLGFYCFDHAGGDALKIVAEEARSRGHIVVNPVKQLPVSDEAMLALLDCDAVVTGLSSFETDMELNVVRRLRDEVPWFVFEDVPEAALRPKAKGVVRRVKLVFAARHDEEDILAKAGYVGSVHLGPPPQWRVEYEAVMAAKAGNARSTEMIKRKGAEAIYSFTENDKFVGTILGKDPDENNRVLRLLKDALLELGDNYVLAISQHPGEKPDLNKAGDEQRFEEAFAERRKILDEVWSFNSGWKGAKLAGTVDVLVSGSASNITIASAYARVPQVWLDDEGVRVRLNAQGTGKWFVPELGGMLVADGAGDLGPMIKTALSERGRQSLLDMQENNFPLPEDWHTENKIVDLLEKVVK